MKLRQGWLLALLAITLSCPASAVRADGLIRDGVGPIATGRGGANQAFSDNSAIILDNPAGMSNVSGTGLGELGVDTAITDVRFSNSFNNDVESKIRPLPSPVLGFIKKSEDERWAVGIGAFAPAGFGASYGVMNNPYLGPQLYRSLGALGKVLPAISYKPTDRLSIGLSVGVAFSYVELNGPFNIQTGPLQGFPVLMDIQGTGAAPTGSVGLQYQLFETTRIGLTYTEQVDINLRGRAHADPLPGAFDSKIQMTWPRSVAFGIKQDLCPHQRVGADVIWYDWSSAFNSIGLSLYNPTNPAVPAILNNFGASLPLKDTLPLRWNDSVSLRLGYEWDFTEWDTWRCGYAYHSSPAPNSTLTPFIDGVLVHAFSMGYSHAFDRATLNLAYQYNYGPTRHVDTSSLVGGDFSNSTLNAQAHFAMISLLFPF